jgi:hypothetical protein
VSGDGRANVDPRTMNSHRVDRMPMGGASPRRVKLQAEAVEIDTHCSLCQAPRITGGVRIWLGKKKLGPQQTYYIICNDCADTIGGAVVPDGAAK